MSLRLIPSALHPTTTPSAPGAPSAPGVHDTLRHNLSLHPSSTTTTTTTTTTAPAKSHPTLQSSHPLESRLLQWRAQQDSLKMTLLRRQFGIAEPVRRGMELAIVRAGEWRPACLGGGAGMAGVHEDVLSGRDCEVGWEDVFVGEGYAGWGEGELAFHGEMEGRFEMMSW